MFSPFIFCFSSNIIAQSNVVDVAVLSKDHTTLIAAVKAAGLANTLKRRRAFHRI